MKKILCLLLLVLSASVYCKEVTTDEMVNERIKKYSEYKKMVEKDREQERQLNMPSKEEIQLYFQNEYLNLEREKLNFEKEISYKKLQEERRRNWLIDSALIGGAGYGIYRIGRHHHNW